MADCKTFGCSFAYPMNVLHLTHKRPLTFPVEWLWSMEKCFVFSLCGLSTPHMAQRPFCSSSLESYQSRVTPYVFFNMLFLCISALFSGLFSRYSLRRFAAFFLFSGFCLHFFMYSFRCGVWDCSFNLDLFFFRHFFIISLYFLAFFFLYSARRTFPHCLQLYLNPSGAFLCLWNSVNGLNSLHLLHCFVFMLNPLAFNFSLTYQKGYE